MFSSQADRGCDASSKAYHKEGSRWYGKTKHGKYISEPDALKEDTTLPKINASV
jgi:hypothetical protein